MHFVQLCKLQPTQHSRYAAGARGTVLCGSPGFVAPEMALAPDYDPFKVDVWALACVALEMLMGRTWFSREWLPAAEVARGGA